jgi:hypothetical protein
MRRVLRVEMDELVADDVGGTRVVTLDRVVVAGSAVPLHRLQARRMAAGHELAAARMVERQAEAETSPSTTSATPSGPWPP